jgi:hypothetical protein
MRPCFPILLPTRASSSRLRGEEGQNKRTSLFGQAPRLVGLYAADRGVFDVSRLVQNQGLEEDFSRLMEPVECARARHLNA